MAMSSFQAWLTDKLDKVLGLPGLNDAAVIISEMPPDDNALLQYLRDFFGSSAESEVRSIPEIHPRHLNI